MDKRQEARLAMLRLVLLVLGKYGAVYAAANGLITAVEALQEIFDGITGQNQQAEDGSNSGGTAARKQATEELGDLAYSISASVLSYASTIGNRSLVDRMSYSRWEITRGRASSIIARCQGVSTTASGLATELANYLVTSGDLKTLEKKITAFEEAYIKPRQGVVSGAAARLGLPALFAQASAILEERIDGMIFKFKDKSPEFYHEFTAARVLVNLPTSSNDKAASKAKAGAEAKAAESKTPGATATTETAANSTTTKESAPTPGTVPAPADKSKVA